MRFLFRLLFKKHKKKKGTDPLLRTILCIIFSLCILIGTILSFVPYQKVNSNNYVETNAIIAGKVCVSTFCAYMVDYTANQTIYHRTIFDYAFKGQQNVGENVSIYYDKNKPKSVTTNELSPLALNFVLSSAIYLFIALISNIKRKLTQLTEYYWFNAITDVFLSLLITVIITGVGFGIGWTVAFAPIVFLGCLISLGIVLCVFSAELMKSGKDSINDRDKWFRNNGKIIDVIVETIVCEKTEEGKIFFRAKCTYTTDKNEKRIMYSEPTEYRLDRYFVYKNKQIQLIGYIDPKNDQNYYIPIEYLFKEKTK